MESAFKGLREVIDELQEQSILQSIPEEIIHVAAEATCRALGDEPPETVRLRARAYFSAVVRKKIATSRSNSGAAARLVALSVIDDLVSSGRSKAEALSELERGWSGKLPKHVIDEYRAQMCA